MKYLTIFSLFSLFALFPFAQECDFEFDYSSDSGWTQVGTLVEIQGGKVQFINGAPDGSVGSTAVGSQRRIHYNLGTTFNSGDTWVAEFEFTPQSVGVHLNGEPHTGHTLLALTAGNQEPFNDCVDLPCNNFPIGSQDGIILNYASDNPSTGDLYFFLKAKDGTFEGTSAFITANTIGVTYYPRIRRITSTQAELEIYSDSTRSTHISGSPVAFTIPAGVDGLTTIQHGNIVRGQVERELTGTLDNLCIRQTNSTRIEKDLLGDLAVYANPIENDLRIDNPYSFQIDVLLLDLRGKTVLKTELSAYSSNNIDFRGLASGPYIIQFSSQNLFSHRKVVKR